MTDNSNSIDMSDKDKSLTISAKAINDIMADAARPPSPPLARNTGSTETEGCNIPFCPKHGIQTRRIRHSVSTLAEISPDSKKTRLIKQNSAIFLKRDVSPKSKKAVPSRLYKSETDIRIILDDDTDADIECARETQRRRMRHLVRANSDKNVRATFDIVNREFAHKISSPGRASTNPMLPSEFKD